jgi:hypothetical protein
MLSISKESIIVSQVKAATKVAKSKSLSAIKHDKSFYISVDDLSDWIEKTNSVPVNKKWLGRSLSQASKASKLKSATFSGKKHYSLA